MSEQELRAWEKRLERWQKFITNAKVIGITLMSVIAGMFYAGYNFKTLSDKVEAGQTALKEIDKVKGDVNELRNRITVIEGKLPTRFDSAR